MTDRQMLTSLGASLLIHLTLIPVASLIPHSKHSAPVTVPIKLVEIIPVDELKEPESIPPARTSKLKAQKITAPRLVSRPVIFETQSLPRKDKTEETKKPEKPPEELPQMASLPPASDPKGGWNIGSKPGEAEGSAGGADDLFSKGDPGVIGGVAVESSRDGQGRSGLGRRAKGDGTGGGGLGDEAFSGSPRPLGGYQVKPRYPESARRARAQGTTLIKLRVLETGKVGEVHIEQSAGHRDLDNAAADAVRKWLFEPARAGKQAVAVWVLLPVKFELN